MQLGNDCYFRLLKYCLFGDGCYFGDRIDIVLHFLVAMRTLDEGERAWLYMN